LKILKIFKNKNKQADFQLFRKSANEKSFPKRQPHRQQSNSKQTICIKKAGNPIKDYPP